MPPIVTARPATDKQMIFLARLLNERTMPAYSGAPMSSREASAMIDYVMGLPRPRRESAPLEAGVYRGKDGADLYRVYPARSGSHMLAKLILTDGGFDYAGAASRFVTAEGRLTREEAAAWGHTFGVCCMCGRLLTDPDSVAAGIGPICAGRI